MLSSQEVFDALDSTHGGKAAGLKALVGLGFEVPAFLTLSASDATKLLEGDSATVGALASWLAERPGSVAVRSSALNEDGSEKSFAGTYETRLDVANDLGAVVQAIDDVSGSANSSRVAAYTAEAGEGRIPVIVQEMVDSRISGVTFTRAIGRRGEPCCYSEWIEGIGEALVSGRVTPSRLIVPWSKERQLVTSEVVAERRLLDPNYVAQLCDAVTVISRERPGAWDIEWAVDPQGVLRLLQLRPATTAVMVPDAAGAATAVAASPGVATGKVFIVEDDTTGDDLADGDVLVAQITEVDFLPAMRRASAIVTEQGGVLSHAAIVARELKKPCIVGVTGARTLLKPGAPATVDANRGIITQGDHVLGTARNQELDWRALFLYDRGFEKTIDCVDAYVEATPAGLFAYVDEELSSQGSAELQGQLRAQLGSAPTVVRDDKLTWFREWQRFNQLAPVTYFEARFKTALARWSPEEITATIDALKQLASDIGRQVTEADTRTHQLYLRELGAALFAQTTVVVEGTAVWTSFRDTSLWRANENIAYSVFLDLTLTDPRHTETTVRIRKCLAVLERFRNETFQYFDDCGAFSYDYFSEREELVKEASSENGIGFRDETTTLQTLYQTDVFKAADTALSAVYINHGHSDVVGSTVVEG